MIGHVTPTNKSKGISIFLSLYLIVISDELSRGMVVHRKGDPHACFERSKKSFHVEHMKMAKFICMHALCILRYTVVHCQ